MTMQVTPRPWISDDGDGLGPLGIFGADRNAIAYFCEPDGQSLDRDPAETDANSALIVRAVNAHEDLLAALQDALASLTAIRKKSQVKAVSKHELTILADIGIGKVQGAISKATS